MQAETFQLVSSHSVLVACAKALSFYCLAEGHTLIMRTYCQQAYDIWLRSQLHRKRGKAVEMPWSLEMLRTVVSLSIFAFIETFPFRGPSAFDNYIYIRLLLQGVLLVRTRSLASWCAIFHGWGMRLKVLAHDPS